MNWSVKTKAWGPKFKPWNMKIECINSCLTIYFLEATNKQLQGKLFIVQKMGFFWCSNRLHNCCQGYKKHFHSCRTHWCRMLFCEKKLQIDKSSNYEFFCIRNWSLDHFLKWKLNLRKHTKNHSVAVCRVISCPFIAFSRIWYHAWKIFFFQLEG